MSPPAERALEVAGVYRIFHSGPVETVALRGCDLEVGKDEFVALLGPSGCGKSTLIQIAAGLDEPSAGRVAIQGQSLAGMNDDNRALMRLRHLGIVFQQGNLLPQLTALDNVALAAKLAGRKDAAARAAGLLEELGLAGRARHRPALLSGGEQQRVALAAALVNDPGLLIADEPTGELDMESEKRVLEMLGEARRRHRCAMLIVTHSEDVAQSADRVVRMKDGVCLH